MSAERERFAWMITSCEDPYRNLALEAALVEDPPADVVLLLWRNARTVVVGLNQNPWAECRVDLLRAEGGRLARRLTGGGAVYHDVGNLNFSFVVRKDLYDVGRQLLVIMDALKGFGLEARCSGRNDLEIDGAKFSGNAFRKTQSVCLHHGTILIRTDSAALARYLTPSPQKLARKGVDSVRQRVVNLSQLVPSLSPEVLMPALVEAFEAGYGSARELSAAMWEQSAAVAAHAEMFASDAFLYDRWRERPGCRTLHCALRGQEVAVSYVCESGCLTYVALAGDWLEQDVLPALAEHLRAATVVDPEVEIPLLLEHELERMSLCMT